MDLPQKMATPQADAGRRQDCQGDPWRAELRAIFPIEACAIRDAGPVLLPKDDAGLGKIRGEVAEFCKGFPTLH